MASSETGNTNNSFGGKYQVFLNFRGLDTCSSFTDSLYHALSHVNISVFMDDEALPFGERIGDNLVQAIDKSKIYIPIFSENYASSHWCLDELARMVRNTSKSKEDGKLILPIFHNVKPDDVKLKTPLYNNAISNLKQQMESQNKSRPEDVQTWQQALKDAGGIKGWELSKNKGYTKLIQEVVEKVVVMLKTREIKITKDFIRMEDQIAEIKNKLAIDSDGVRLIGIYGIGGIGKTTLAKAIFNDLYVHFGTNCSFLDDVREAAKNKQLVELQKKLLSDISDNKVTLEITNEASGTNKIEETICNRKMLIVLDDVDESKQNQTLVGERDLYSGTRILVTTRNMSVLTFRGFECQVKKFEVVRMSEENALKLFSKHAFNEDSPLKNFYTLSRKIVSTVGGLPLVLQTIGSSLYRQKKRKIWEERLAKLKTTPYEDVMRQLRISYDDLKPNQKQIFLDVACFFNGEDKTIPMYVWEGCEFCPEDAIDVLTKRCMIEILDGDRIRMHDEFRDLGRTIAEKDYIKLGDEDDIIDKLNSSEPKESAQALCLESSGDLITATSEQIKRFPRIRFLKLCKVICRGDFRGCLSELRWIHLGYGTIMPEPKRYRNQCLEATHLRLKNVVVVNLTGLDITEDAFKSLIMGARKLKVLTIKFNTSMHEIPIFPQNSVLEKLTIYEFWSLTEIDCSIGNLKQLTDLSFECCYYLRKLPREIGELHNLRHLSLKSCHHFIELPNSVSKLESLTKLDVSSTEITRLPHSIGGLLSLSSLNVSFTLIKKLPSTMSKLCQLQTLELFHCNGIQELPKLPSSLTNLQFASTSLLKMPNLSYLTNLVGLRLADSYECSRHKSTVIQTCDLGWIGSLTKLRKLNFRFPNVCAPTPELGSLSLLEELTLYGLDLPTFEQLPSDLIVLELYETRGKQVHLDGLPPSEKERSVCQPEEAGCNELQATELIDHWGGEIIFPSSLKTLQKCRLSGFPEVQDIRFVSTFESLEIFSVEECSSLKSLGGLSNSKNLKRLTIEQCPSLKVVEGIDELEFLHWLTIRGCTSMGRIFDASSSKIPKKCMILITCTGELPDCGNTYDTWDSYREKILNGTKQASDSEIETTNSETETGGPLQKTNQENKEKKRKRKTESAKQQGKRKRRKLQKKAWNQENEDRKRQSKTVGKRTGKKKEGKKDLKWTLGTRWLSRSQIVNRIGIRVLTFFLLVLK